MMNISDSDFDDDSDNDQSELEMEGDWENGKMMHMFDSTVTCSDSDNDLKELVASVYNNFTSIANDAFRMLDWLGDKNLCTADGDLIQHTADGDLIRPLEQELRFLKAFFRSVIKWCIEDGIQRKLVDILARIEHQFKCASTSVSYYISEVVDGDDPMDFDEITSKLLDNIKTMKPEIVEAYYSLFLRSSPSKYPMSADLVEEFIQMVIGTLEVLLVTSCGAVSSKRKQVLDIRNEMIILGTFIWFSKGRGLGENLKEMLIHAEAMVDKTAGLCYFLWSDSDVDIEPMIRQLSAGFFKALPQFYSRMTDEFQLWFLDYLQENLVVLLKNEVIMEVPVKNQIGTLIEELRLLKHLLIILPKYAEQTEVFDVRTHITDMARKIASVICSYPNNENMASEISSGLSGILENIKLDKADHSEMFSQVLTRQKLKFPKVFPVGFFDCLLQDLKELISSKSDVIIDLKDQILAIHGDLVLFRSFLQDITNHPDVVNRIIVAAYEAEHLITSLVSRVYPVWYQSRWISHFKEEIKLIKAAVVENIEKTNNDKRINISGKRPTHVPYQALAPTDVVGGFMDEMELIKERLARGTNQLDIVSIVGMPGLGKSTLAKRVYEDRLIVDHFSVRAWCHVSPNYDKKEMLLSILSFVIKITDKIRELGDENLSVKLHKELKGRRYLIVLDDVWGMDALDVLKRFFPDDSKGSRIMLTSRDKSIGLAAKHHSNPLELRRLTDDESWDLLEKKIFQEEMCPYQLQKVGKQIAQKCNGLPLAVVVVAGLLSKADKEQDFWDQVAENLTSRVLGDPEGQAMEVLELSYKLLPDYLKPLFLYLGAFPVDKVIPVRKLTWLWIAEGFVQKDEAETMLMDLIHRSLVIIADIRYNGRVKACRVHDLLRDLCAAKAKEENFLHQLHMGRLLNDTSFYEHRRLSILFKELDDLSPMPFSPLVRSLLFFSNRFPPCCRMKVSYKAFWKLILLRVLDMGICETYDEAFVEVQMLVHLRYFSIGTRNGSIPSSIGNLQNLETLIVIGSSEIVVPVEIWKLAKLRHLHISKVARFIVDGNAPENSSKLLNLETLSKAMVYYGEEKKLIGRIPNLRKLKCFFVKPLDVTLNCSVFEGLVFVDKLESLNALCFDKLQFQCELNHLPLNLKKLTLSRFYLQWSQISTLQKLPNLEILKLLYKAVKGELWDMGDGDFPKLKVLKLTYLNIRQWSASSDNFPCLKQLVIEDCKQLEEIPSGLGDICSLEKIEVQRCRRSAAKSAKQIEEEQMDAENDLLKVHIYPPYLESVTSSDNE